MALVLEGRYGIGIGEDADAARAELEGTVARLAVDDEWLRANPRRLEWWGARYLPADIPANPTIVSTLTGAFQEANDRSTPVQGMPYGADMHLLVHQGRTPTVIFGPGDVRLAHAPDESVPITELEEATRTLALTILRFSGT